MSGTDAAFEPSSSQSSARASWGDFVSATLEGSGDRAQVVKLAGRKTASSVSERETKGLLRERQTLLDKKFAGQLSRREELRLEYVRWSLDRIEEAAYGPVLDALEGAAATYESFGADVAKLYQELHAATKKRKPPK